MKSKNFFSSISLFGYSIFLVAYTFLFYTQFARENNIAHLFTIMRLFALLVVIVGFFFQRYSFKELTLFLFAGLFCSFEVFQSGILDIIITLIMLIGLKDVSFRKIIKTDFCVRLISTVTIGLLAVEQIIPSNDFYSGAKFGFLRHSFGFFHPNTFGAYIMILTLEFVYLGYKNKSDTMRVWIIPIAVIFLEMVSNNRTAEVSMLLYFILYLVLSLRGLNKVSTKFYKTVAAVAIAVAVAFSLSMAYLYNASSSLWINLNHVLSSRPRMLNSIVNGIYPIKMWGQKTPLIGNLDGINFNGINMITFVDNSYIGMLIKYGIIFFIVFSIYYLYKIFTYMETDQRKVMLCWFVAIVSWAVSEDKIVSIQFNTLLFIIFNNSLNTEQVENTIS